MNLGRIKGAIHVGAVDSLPAVMQQLDKTAPYWYTEDQKIQEYRLVVNC
jgi:hypothetical protein